MTSDPTEIGWLLGGRCGLTAAGRIHWADENSNYCARLPLTARNVNDGDAGFVYRIGKNRASEPTLLIRYKRQCVYRLDVNQGHRDGSKVHHFGTHLHRRRSLSDPSETFEPDPLGVPQIVIGQRVTPQEYRTILNAFAAPIGMDILDVTWADPPEGRQP